MNKTAALFVLVALGCGSPAAPDGAQFSFSAQKVATALDDPPITISATSMGLRVDGGMTVGCAGAELSGEVAVGGTISVQVIADQNSRQRACRNMVESFTYRADLTGLPRGTYQVEVRHVLRWWDTDPAPQVTRTEVLEVSIP